MSMVCGALDLDRFQLLGLDLDVFALAEFVAAALVSLSTTLAGLFVHHLLAQPVAGLAVDLVKMRFLGLAGGGIERDGTGHQRQLEITLPIGQAPPCSNSQPTSANAWPLESVPPPEFVPPRPGSSDNAGKQALASAGGAPAARPRKPGTLRQSQSTRRHLSRARRGPAARRSRRSYILLPAGDRDYVALPRALGAGPPCSQHQDETD